MEQNKELNRLKVVLVEKKRTAKWLAQELGKDAATISKWNSNTSQPSLEIIVYASRKYREYHKNALSCI